MSIILYNDAAFRAQFKAFISELTYPAASLQVYWDMATAYISDQNGGCYFGGAKLKQQVLALNLMTAHLVYINDLTANGENTGVITGATIDKITVTLQPPPETSQWQYWLNSSPYGQQLLALLQVISAGGYYITSGMPGRAGFR